MQIKEGLTQVVRNLNYRGRIKIIFPISNPGVEIYNEHWVNRWRNTTWICMLFYVSMLWIITWPVLFFMTKKYDVVRVDYPFSKKDEDGCTKYATISEQQWLERWKNPIAKAVMDKRQCTLTEPDLLRDSNESNRLRATGNQTADTVVNLVHAGLQVYNEVNRQVGWGYDQY